VLYTAYTHFPCMLEVRRHKTQPLHRSCSVDIVMQKTLAQRGRHLLGSLHQYNWHRPHARIDYLPPISRVPCPVNNLMA
jgi:hypothetical protein